LSVATVNQDVAWGSATIYNYVVAVTSDGAQVGGLSLWYPPEVATSDGIETITGTGDNALVGGAGNELFNLGPYDNVTLGSGSDTVDLESGGLVNVIQLGNGTALINTGDVSESYVANAGFGSATIIGTGQSMLTFGAGILPQDIELAQQGNDLILTDTLSGNSIDFSGWYSNTTSELSQVDFPDNSEWEPISGAPAQPFGEDLYASAGNESLVGTAGNDTLNSDHGGDTLVGGSGATTLIGGLGTDLLVAGTGNNLMESSSGPDTYEFGTGFGSTTIDADSPSYGVNSIQFLAGIDASQLTYAEDGPDLVITVAESDGDSNTITLANHFVNGMPIASDVSALTFADGTSVTMAQINQQFGSGSGDSDGRIDSLQLAPDSSGVESTPAVSANDSNSSDFSQLTADSSAAPSTSSSSNVSAVSTDSSQLAADSTSNSTTESGASDNSESSKMKAPPPLPSSRDLLTLPSQFNGKTGMASQSNRARDPLLSQNSVEPYGQPYNAADQSQPNDDTSANTTSVQSTPSYTSPTTSPANTLKDLNQSDDLLLQWAQNSAGAVTPSDPLQVDQDDAAVWAAGNSDGQGAVQRAGTTPSSNEARGQASYLPSRSNNVRLNRTANAANEMVKALSAQSLTPNLSGKGLGNPPSSQIQLQEGTVWSLSQLDRTMAALSPNTTGAAERGASVASFGSADLAHAQLVEAMASFNPETSAESALLPAGSEAYAITLAAHIN
jgi:hypothetical protein